MKLTALVLEDEWTARSYLVELLRDTGRFDAISAVATPAEATEVVRATCPDAVFADIRLRDRPGDVSGIDWARRILKEPFAPSLVLATALSEHATIGFELGAVDYLLKPFQAARVQQCVDRLFTRVRRSATRESPPRLIARDGDKLVFLDWSGLLAFEAANRLTHAHHESGTYLVDLSLSALAGVCGDSLLRAHRSWLISPTHVRALRRLDGELVLLLGDALEVPVARDRAKALRKALLRGTIGLRGGREP